MNLFPLLAMASLAVPAANTYTDGDREKPVAEHPLAPRAQYKALDDILGADVLLKPTLAERLEASKEGETAEGPTASLDDLIMRTRDGAVESAVVSFGGFFGIGDKTVVLPVDRLTWNEEAGSFEVNATEEQLGHLPAFDLDEARRKGLDTEYTLVCRSWVTAGFPEHAVAKDADAESKRVKLLQNTACVVIPVQYICASEFADLSVETLEGEESGSLANCIVDCEDGKIAFAVVDGLADGEYVLPMTSLMVCEKDENASLCLAYPVSSLEAAVKPKEYDSDAAGMLSRADAEAAKRWCEAQAKCYEVPSDDA